MNEKLSKEEGANPLSCNRMVLVSRTTTRWSGWFQFRGNWDTRSAQDSKICSSSLSVNATESSSGKNDERHWLCDVGVFQSDFE
jgi:hypothetical protein